MNAHEYALQANGSFALPDACFKIKALMEDNDSTIEDFANVISVDPSMTSRLLQIANSAIYSFPGEISTISRAITIIGTQAIYNMMLVDVAATAFKHFANDSIDLKRFWHMSVFCGLASKNLAITAGIRDIERLFVAGLLQNFGELIVAKISPELAKQCENYSGDSLPWPLQQQVLGFTYTEVSAELLKIWQLPEKIILPIRHYNNAQNIQIDQDFGVWTGFKLQKDLPKKFDLSLEQQLRTWKNSTRIDKYWAELQLNYSINKNFRINGDIRYIHNSNKRRRPDNSLRYNLGIQLRLKIQKKLLFTFKAQYQQKFTYFYGAFSSTQTSSTRYKIKLRLKHNKYHKFYFSTELFVRSDLTSVPFLDKQRFNVGDNIKIKTGEFNVGIGYDVSLQRNDFFSLFFIKIIYTIKL